MMINFIGNWIIYEIGNENYAKKILKVAEEKINFCERSNKVNKFRYLVLFI